MKALLGDTVIAEAAEADLVRVEGNWYFPPASIVAGALVETDTPYHCSWKGDAQYFTVRGDATEAVDGAWSYPALPASASERVGREFAGYVAFGSPIRVTE